MGLWGWIGALLTWLALQLWVLPKLGVATCAVPRQPTYPPPQGLEPLAFQPVRTTQPIETPSQAASRLPWPRPLRAEYRNNRPRNRYQRHPRQV